MSWSVQVAERPDDAARARIDAFVTASSEGHLYQYPLLGRIEDGPSVRTLCAWAERDGELGATAVARLRRIRGIGPWVARVDRGPVVAAVDAAAPLLEGLSARLLDEGVASVRVNPQRRREDGEALIAALEAAGFHAVPDDDYGVTLSVDIDLASDALLAGFAKGTRYAIRQAQKAGVECGPASGGDVAALGALYADMVRRKGATPRPAGFFEEIARFLGEDATRGFILVSRFSGETVGGIVVTRYGTRGLYTFGASKDSDDGIPKTHLLQFEAMVAARALGCTSYDLGGFSAGVGEEGSRTAAQSINFFKSRFTKNQVSFVPCHERVLRPLAHHLVHAAKRLARSGA